MSRRIRHIGAALAVAAALPVAACSQASLAPATSAVESNLKTGIHGTVRDPLGALVPNARVELLSGATVVDAIDATASAGYTLPLPHSGHYSLRVSAPTFSASTTPPRYFRGSAFTQVDLTVATPTDTQQITVSATGVDTPEAQIGASVTVLEHNDFRFMTEVQTPLRLVPGVQVTQSGQLGGFTGLSIRGGDTSANKVLLDGTPADQIGGGVEFANLATLGVDRIEVLREPNSALYGSDALAGVISLTTPRGSTRLPLFTYAGDAGNFHSYRNEVTAGTTYRQFDLFAAFARQDTHNSLPNSEFHNATFATNLGWTPNAANDVRFTVHHVLVTSGQPNALALYGLAQPDQQKQHDTYFSAVWNNQTTARWHNQIRYGGLRLNGSFNDYGVNGIPDGAGDFDSPTLTVTGANGYSVTGQAYIQFGNTPYQFLETTQRDFVYAQSDYRLNPHFLALGAFKFEGESGGTGDSGTTPSSIARGNYSYTLQFSGDTRNRLFYSFGTGLENNGLFGFAGTPRASLAYYLFRPTASGFFAGTKLHGSFNKGIREPSIFQQNNSLNGLLVANNLPTTGVATLGPQSSRTYDAGLDQQLLNGRARIGVTYFHSQFTGVPEFAPQSELMQLYPGIDLSTAPYGAYVNSLAFRSQGIEFESEFELAKHLSARAGYTYTDAVVENSFGTPSFNTSFNFSNVAIGAYSPLPGARPFRVAPHTGYFQLDYHRSRLTTNLSGTLVGRRDDSDFLSDANFGNSLLLPNRNLDGAYQRLELGTGYQLTPRIDVYTNIQNLLSEHFYEAFGYPALPLTFRSGIKINFGGESWKLK